MSDAKPMWFENLFSYGTLQLEAVQLSTFGRVLEGRADEMPGYAQGMVQIEDPEVVRTSGKTHHPIVRYTGNPTDSVRGTMFTITADELRQADTYEVSAYRRDRVSLRSGHSAWVYVDARSPTSGQ
ncbi:MULTISPECIES: gamma-glutamylcyclotransferase family protein [Burkholderia cepacia complex]|uniref:Gamma-glutamylcyclotransferase AIG2-like domain-containing protein n=2 Tax=Burkholderiaceae TaxID=119060 RepID=A0ABU2EC29_9BURK|nr:MULTISPECIES: gamma-glutamylcyclotransferase family protein [Burkholderia]MBR8428281.1 gamma-glutamylcyclotransferase [Burkholderia cenocepacia]MDN7669315.1 gamma-glutamylcyclotransferase family protein [Burkholderia vietnamiensis]MDR8731158.1 hypothetical protein [Burkholderia pseudomultivorans]MDR8738753.1 hypothetical protein [Burkholderia pseudomultivorans]MDR8745334.1 hypothetical protein [Burkholderia pseudomultivorans]